jgi:hypothetical protein
MGMYHKPTLIVVFIDICISMLTLHYTHTHYHSEYPALFALSMFMFCTIVLNGCLCCCNQTYFASRLPFYLVVILTYFEIKKLVPMVRISHAETNVKNSKHIHKRKHAKPDYSGERGSISW